MNQTLENAIDAYGGRDTWTKDRSISAEFSTGGLAFRLKGLLHRHDYTAEVIGGLAKAAHVVLEHSDSDGLEFTSRRRVTPRSSHGRAFRFPTLIEIAVHDYQLH